MKILITGSNGLLGQKIVEECLTRGIEFLATSQGQNRNVSCPIQNYQSMDICDPQQVELIINSFAPSHIVHTAAITNVDACELDPENCRRVNVIASNNLFDIAKRLNVHFQLLSTDFVFDGQKGHYVETDPVGPLSSYAQSKVDAENYVLQSSYLNWSIVRTIIVYGQGNNLSRSNIVLWAKEALLKGEEIRIVDDQFRAPTWANDLAWACVELCEKNKIGIYHICGPETMSIYELVSRIADYFGTFKTTIFPVKSIDLKQPAKRPPITGFDISKAKKEISFSPKTLEETLALL
jgi:dTDP-4-dehydrorhamnose reductase